MPATRARPARGLRRGRVRQVVQLVGQLDEPRAGGHAGHVRDLGPLARGLAKRLVVGDLGHNARDAPVSSTVSCSSAAASTSASRAPPRASSACITRTGCSMYAARSAFLRTCSRCARVANAIASASIRSPSIAIELNNKLAAARRLLQHRRTRAHSVTICCAPPCWRGPRPTGACCNTEMKRLSLLFIRHRGCSSTRRSSTSSAALLRRTPTPPCFARCATPSSPAASPPRSSRSSPGRPTCARSLSTPRPTSPRSSRRSPTAPRRTARCVLRASCAAPPSGPRRPRRSARSAPPPCAASPPAPTRGASWTRRWRSAAARPSLTTWTRSRRSGGGSRNENLVVHPSIYWHWWPMNPSVSAAAAAVKSRNTTAPTGPTDASALPKLYGASISSSAPSAHGTLSAGAGAAPPAVARVGAGAGTLDRVHGLPPGAAVFVDEGFLFADLAAGVEWLCAHGHAVFVASIQYDYNRVWFENVRALVERHAATTYVLAGACATPGGAAPSAFTRRTAPVATRVAIDGAYAPACAACWRPPPE